jgi:hypothetical protein
VSRKRYEGEGDLPDDEGMLCHHTECRRDLWRKTIMLTDPGKVHDFLGPRRRYDRMAFFTTPAEKRQIVEIDPDWCNLLHHVVAGDMRNAYSLPRSCYKGEAGVGYVSDDYRRAVLKLLRTWPHLGIL